MEFYTSIAPYYDDIFGLDENQKTFVRNNMGDTAGTFIDAGSGSGNLSIAVSDVAHNVIGIEYDPELVHIANLKIVNRTNVSFKKGDMTDIRKTIKDFRITTVVCIGNTLVHLIGPEVIEKFICEAWHVLEKGGKLIIQIINYDRILKYSIDELNTIENDRIKFIRKYDFDPVTRIINFKTRLTIKHENNRIVENSVFLYPLVKDELDAMLKKNGFHNIHYYGSYNSAEYTTDSSLLISVSEKC